MANSSKFWTLKFPSHELRGEVLNVGLLIERDGVFSVCEGRKLDKVRAISAAIDPTDILDELSEIEKAVQDCPMNDIETRLSSMTFLECKYQGSFDPGSEDLREHYVADLLRRYVDPEPAPPKPVRKKPTKLRQEMVQLFRSEKILAKPSEGLDSHRVLYKHRLAEGVEADFVLKNGSLHVVESIDASSSEVSLQRCLFEIGLSNLTFEHARIGFGNNSVKPRLVYQASSALEKALAPSLYAVERQGAELINWASQDSRMGFLDNFAALAESIDSQRNAPSLFHASALPSRKLN